MAKELPYFKFEPNQWESGNIQICGRASKGLFMDLCSLYWSRLGELPYALALQKLCNGDNHAFSELDKAQVFIVENDFIIIEFLDEQLNEFQETSKKRAKAANKRWNDANAMQVHSKSNAIREEKRREEKKRKEEIENVFVLPFESKLFSDMWNDWLEYRKQIKKKMTESTIKKQLSFLSKYSEDEAIIIIETSIQNGWQGLFEPKPKRNEKLNPIQELSNIYNRTADQ